MRKLATDATHLYKLFCVGRHDVHSTLVALHGCSLVTLAPQRARALAVVIPAALPVAVLLLLARQMPPVKHHKRRGTRIRQQFDS